MEHSLS